MSTSTLAGLTPAVSVPTDVYEFIRIARRDYEGTDYPGALDLGRALSGFFDSPREKRAVASLLVVALEADNELSGIAARELVDGYLSTVDLKG